MFVPVFRGWVRRVPWWLIGNPFEAFVAVLCVFGGIPLALGHAQPSSIDFVLPVFLQHIWGGILVFGGAFVLAGVTGGIRSSRYRYELAGLALLIPASFVYAICTIIYAGTHGLASAGILLAFCVGCLFRYALISQAAHIVREQQVLTSKLARHLHEMGIRQ